MQSNSPLTRKPNTFKQYRELIRNAKVSPVRTILDYGCGYGSFLPYYKDYYPDLEEVCGYDLLLPNINSLPPWARLIQSLDEGLSTYDLIIANHVLDTLLPEERYSVTEEVLRHLSPSGTALFTVDTFALYSKDFHIKEKGYPGLEYGSFYLGDTPVYKKYYRMFELLYELEWFVLGREQLPKAELYLQGPKKYKVGVVDSNIQNACYIKEHS